MIYEYFVTELECEPGDLKREKLHIKGYSDDGWRLIQIVQYPNPRFSKYYWERII